MQGVAMLALSRPAPCSRPALTYVAEIVHSYATYIHLHLIAHLGPWPKMLLAPGHGVIQLQLIAQLLYTYHCFLLLLCCSSCCCIGSYSAPTATALCPTAHTRALLLQLVQARTDCCCCCLDPVYVLQAVVATRNAAAAARLIVSC